MAKDFDYTSKTWDSIRPTLLKKTGLGEALKKYETKKAALKDAAGVAEIMAAHKEAVSALEAVDDAIEKAITACGTSHKDCKTALEKAKSAEEKKRIDGYPVTKFNALINDAAKELKQAETLYGNRLSEAEKMHKALSEIGEQPTLEQAKTLTDARRIYAGDGDEHGRSLMGDFGADFERLFIHRAKMSGSFPTVFADLQKMSEKIDEVSNKDKLLRKKKAEMMTILKKHGYS
ncbi:MAG TPA: hypothetical protein VGE52_16270 [Pirellulales bacterium]